MSYPEILLPRQTYPILTNEDIKNNALVRETIFNVYQFLAGTEYEPDDIMPFVVAPQPSLREVFALSTFLFGYFKEEHIGIRVDDTTLYADWNKDLPGLKRDDIKFSQEKAYPLFLAATKLDHQEINFNNETFVAKCAKLAFLRLSVQRHFIQHTLCRTCKKCRAVF